MAKFNTDTLNFVG